MLSVFHNVMNKQGMWQAGTRRKVRISPFDANSIVFPGAPDVSYKVMGVVCSSGDTAFGGHYWCWRRANEHCKRFCKMDDTAPVQTCEYNNFDSIKNPYIMILKMN